MKCPKCNASIGRLDLAPNCKKCGVHIMYYTQEEDLRRDAKKTELEFSSARLLVAKLKAAFIGGKIQILRFVFLLLSVLSFLIPSFNISLSFPWWDYDISVGALGVYNIIADSFWQIFDALWNLELIRPLFTVTLCSFIMLLLAVLMMLVCLVSWILSFISIKKTAIINTVCSVIAILSQIFATVLSFIAVNSAGIFEYISAKPIFGSIVSIIMLSAFLATNIILMINVPEVHIKEADRKRLEIKEKLKKGEITLDELPLPIIEEEKEEKTEKTKKRGKKKK